MLEVQSSGCHRLQIVSHCGHTKTFDTLADVAKYASDNGYTNVSIPADVLARFAPVAQAA